MSSIPSIFVQTSASYEEFVSQMEELLGVKFVKREDVSWPLSKFRGLMVEISLIGDLDYEDDPGLYFSQYDYQICLEITHRDRDGDFWEELEYYFTMNLYSWLTLDLNLKCMAVNDSMQRLLARN